VILTENDMAGCPRKHNLIIQGGAKVT